MELEDYIFEIVLEDSYVVQYSGPFAFQYAKISKTTQARVWIKMVQFLDLENKIGARGVAMYYG